MNTTATRTPCPWAYEPTSGAIYFADGDVEPVIAGINQDNTSEEQADADGVLLAAAPALLEELDVRVGDLVMLRKAIEAGDPRAELFVRIDDMLRETRAAIAKAGGA